MRILVLLSCCLALWVAVSVPGAKSLGQAQPNRLIVQSTLANVMRTFQGAANRQSSSSSQHQETRITLSTASLRQPCILKIETSATRLNGEIRSDNEIIQRLNSRISEIDLAPQLERGENTIELSINYAPTTATVNVEFTAPGTTVSQQSSGNHGSFRHVLVIDVY